jgi:aspartate carbamoyltransferase catalytic subunit
MNVTPCRWEDWPHVLRMQQFTAADLIAITNHANNFFSCIERETALPRLSALIRHRVHLLFYEPSTRTTDTFDGAAIRLGCQPHEPPDPTAFSSAVKGQSLEAAIGHHVFDCSGFVVRHTAEGSSERAATVVDTMVASRRWKPRFVINAGDGGGQHPTQALTDLTMIARRRPEKFLRDLTIFFPGDLVRSRVVNSLLYAFGKFEEHNIHVLFCCPDGFSPKAEILLYLSKHGIGYNFVPPSNYTTAICQADVVYMTRMQRERGGEKGFSRSEREAYVFRKEHLDLLREGAFVMHPLPVNEDPDDPPAEIQNELMPMAYAGDARCAWIDQSHLGLAVRAALFDLIFAGMDQGWKPSNST